MGLRSYISLTFLGLTGATLFAETLSCPSPAQTIDLRKNSVGFLVYEGNLHCTATLLSPHVLLTAAHCVKGRLPTAMTFSLDPDAEVAIHHAAVEELVPHPAFNLRTQHSDVALVKLADTRYGAAPVSYYILGEDDVPAGRTAMIIGFGTDGQGLKGFRREKRVLSSPAEPRILRVAGISEKNKPCAGDSGAPLVVHNEGRSEIVGVHSFKRTLTKRGALAHKFIDKPALICRSPGQSFAASVKPFIPWLVETWKRLETTPKFASCP